MDANAEITLGESSQSSRLGYTYESVAVDNPSLHIFLGTCAFCQRTLSQGNDSVDLEAIGICGDCRFLLLEDHENTSPDAYQRRMCASRGRRRRRRRRRYGSSSETIDSAFTHQFSQMINLARQTQLTVFEHDNQSVVSDASVGPMQRAISRTTPSGSRRWRRMFSDTESDGFDSLYGENESNASFRRYRLFHCESDTMSYSAYGGESDASVEAGSFLEIENFVNPDGASELETDTDIDPMNAGLYQWNSEGEENEDEDDSEWEDADIEGNTVQSSRVQNNLHESLGSNVGINLQRRILPPEIDVSFPRRIQERIQAQTADLVNFVDTEAPNYIGESGDYLDSRVFEDLFDHLAEPENPRRGAPPAAASFLSNMPCVRINEDTSSGCAICKDPFSVGTVVNQLPCLHLYHTNCIFPWLSARNSCPLCRYELPTDDADYEERSRVEHHHIRQLNLHTYRDEEQRDILNVDSARANHAVEKPRNRWFYFAAPIVSMVGISLVLWLGKPSADRRLIASAIPSRRENSQRRWSFF